MSLPRLELDGAKPCYYLNAGDYKVIVYEGPVRDDDTEYDFVCVVQDLISRETVIIITAENSVLGYGSFLSYFDEEIECVNCKELSTSIRLDSFIRAASQVVQEQQAVKEAGARRTSNAVEQPRRETRPPALHPGMRIGGGLVIGALAVAVVGALTWIGPARSALPVSQCALARMTDTLVGRGEVEPVRDACAGAGAKALVAEDLPGNAGSGSASSGTNAVRPEVNLVSLSQPFAAAPDEAERRD